MGDSPGPGAGHDSHRGGEATTLLFRRSRSTRTLRRWLAPVLAVILAPAGLAAQTPSLPAAPAAPQAQPTPADPYGRSTPWGAVTGFVNAGDQRDFVRALQYLDTHLSGSRAEQLARQLFTVMNRGLNTDLDRLSRSPDGNLEDGLPPEQDRVGIINTPSGPLDVLVERVAQKDAAPVWLFSAHTLALVPRAAEETSTADPEDYLPRSLVETTILSQPLYRWLFVPLLLGVAWLLGSLVTRASLPLLRRPLRRLTGDYDERVAAELAAPMRLVFVAIGLRAYSTVGLSLQGRQFWTSVSIAVGVVGLTWLVLRFSAIVLELAGRRLRHRRRFGKIAVLGLVGRLFRASIVVVAALVLLYRAGVDMTAILTGLGIGGIGIALAAQKTLENLFGGIMIISDEPVRVGDFCQVADQMGTVEDIGLRSTRIRTLARTVVAVPNGQLATMNVENFSRRDKFWLRHALGVRYETSPEQMRHLLAGVRAMLYAHPKVEQDGARIRFIGFGGSSLDLEIFAYVYAMDFSEFLAIQEDVLLRVMDLVAESCTSIAFPSQTTYLARDTPLDADRT
jgi:MscS family membrane protein